ncbi:MAG: ABC transporter substrate-binding protein [Bauldia sp.]|nr:ABC transporter substrate-binding protein [Bauldia sp.]
MRRISAVFGTAGALLAALVVTAPALAQDDAPAVTPFPIGFVELANDPRVDPERTYYEVQVRPWGSSLAGAELAIQDSQTIGNVINVGFTLRDTAAASIDEAIATVREWAAEGMHFVVVNVPAAEMLALADGVADLPVTLFNTTAAEDYLRGESCRANVVHTAPSQRMLTDAMVQFLVTNRWTNILVLEGPSEADASEVAALRQSATLFGARIVDVRPFILSNDPRNREENNVALITAQGNYDVVYIADSDGEFARFATYEVNNPRPVVGAAGLTAAAWHWSYQKQGSSEITQRFDDVGGRHMQSQDWTAWISIRAIVQSVLRGQTTEYQGVRDYLLGDRMNLDGGKGNPMSVRSWDHQLRQAIPLASANAVFDEAPITGFLHPTNDLDTLGVDERQTTCRF